MVCFARFPVARLPGCPVPGSRFPVPGSRFPVPGTRYPVPRTPYPVPGTRYPVSNPRFLFPYPVPRTPYPVPGSRPALTVYPVAQLDSTGPGSAREARRTGSITLSGLARTS